MLCLRRCACGLLSSAKKSKEKWEADTPRENRVVGLGRFSSSSSLTIPLRTEDNPRIALKLSTRSLVTSKYTHLDDALALLKEGGLYVIDDMSPQANWPAG